MNSLRAFLSLSRSLQLYLLTWYVLGVLALGWAINHLRPAHWNSIAAFMLLSLILNIKIVRGALKSQNGSATVSLASAAAFGAIAGVHPMAGVPVEAFGIVMDSVFPKRRPLYQALFNISVCAVGTASAGLVYRAFGGPQLPFLWHIVTSGQNLDMLIPNMARAAGPMLAASLTYFVINTMAVAEVVALFSGASLQETWKRSFQTSFVGYTASGACAVFVLGLWPLMPAISLLLLSGPILYACYSREQTDEARVVALERGKERLEGMAIASIKALALTVAARDRYTSGHIQRVMSYAEHIARQMGRSEEELTDLKTGALLHDIGKIGVPEHILTKPGRLTDDEMNAMRNHAPIGWTILQPLGFPEIVKSIVRNHHEWFNGTGYPDGLAGNEIPILVRIVGVADVFDALTTDRPYRAAMSEEEARSIMRRNSGSQFDPDVLQAFFEVLDTITFERLRAMPSEFPDLSQIVDTLPGPVSMTGRLSAPPTDSLVREPAVIDTLSVPALK